MSSWPRYRHPFVPGLRSHCVSLGLCMKSSSAAATTFGVTRLRISSRTSWAYMHGIRTRLGQNPDVQKN